MLFVRDDLAVDHLEARVQLFDLGSNEPLVLLQQSKTILLITRPGPDELGEPPDRGDRHARLAQPITEQEPLDVRGLVDPMPATGARDRPQKETFALEEPQRMDAHPCRVCDPADREAVVCVAHAGIIA